MVTTYASTIPAFFISAVNQPNEPVLKMLDPPRRAAVMMALLGLVLVGLLLVTCAMIGARWVRRMARHNPGSRRSKAVDSAAENQRLRNALRSVLPEAKTDDTVELGKLPPDTRVDL
jgi:hypothetical protein